VPLTTRCRHCGRLFPVYAADLKADRGRVSCPQCGKGFDAVAGLIDEPVPQAEDPARLRHPARRAPTAPLAGALAESLAEASARRRHRAGRWLWGFGVLSLTVGLAAQAAWWRRGELVRLPQVQWALGQVCPRLGCQIPLPRLPGTIEILQSSLAADPARPEALRLRLVLVNRAEVAQRPPVLELELYDGRSSLLAARRFEPGQYLADEAGTQAEGLVPNRPIRAALDIALAGPLPSTQASSQASTQSSTQPTGFRVRLL